jgi:signal transduction histidine kinase
VKDTQLKTALAEIETQNKLQEQRLRISRDLHDNIGSQLTFVISSLDNLKFGKKLPKGIADKLAMIGEFTSGTIHELRDTIWAMNKSDITLEDLLVRLSNYIDKANLASNGVEFKLEKTNITDSEISFSSLKGMNIYRIVQEAFNNSLKYSNSKVIELSIRDLTNTLEFEIKDYGKGFDVTEVAMGNGLNNMKKRAKDIDAEISIHSEKDSGTTVLLNISKAT